MKINRVPPLVPVRDAAKLLGVSPQRIGELIRGKRLDVKPERRADSRNRVLIAGRSLQRELVRRKAA